MPSLAASRGGDFDVPLALLDPEVLLRADDAVAVLSGADGASGRRRWPTPLRGGQQVVFGFTVTGGCIVAMGILAGPEGLAGWTWRSRATAGERCVTYTARPVP
jgi:hypothetical protein